MVGYYEPHARSRHVEWLIAHGFVRFTVERERGHKAVRVLFLTDAGKREIEESGK